MFKLIQRRLYSTIKYPPPPSHYETKPAKKYWKKISFLAFVSGAIITYNYPIYTIVEKSIPLPKDEEETTKYNENLESKLNNLPLVNHYRNDKSFIESRGWHHLETATAGLEGFHGTLLTPGGIAIPPLAFHSENGDDIVFVHVGRRLSGYPFIVHGGILGSIIDETQKANIIKEFPYLTPDTIHTKSLNVKYKFPTFVNQFIVIRSSVNKSDPNSKTYTTKADISTIGGTLLMEATSTLSAEDPLSFESSQSSSSKWLKW